MNYELKNTQKAAIELGIYGGAKANLKDQIGKSFRYRMRIFDRFKNEFDTGELKEFGMLRQSDLKKFRTEINYN